jgi:MSHA biogenesis protein MshL
MQYRPSVKIVTLLSALLLLSSCALTPQGTVDHSAIDAISRELIEANVEPTAPVTAPSQVVDALLPPLLPGAGTEQGLGQDALERFDVAVQGVSALNFFMGLVKDTGYNMVVHPKVDGVISLELNDVTLAEVMDIVREVYGYPYKQRGNLYQVFPGGLRSEVFQIDYLSLKRQGVSETQITNGQVSNSGSSNSSNRGSGSNNNDSNSNDNRGSQGTIGAQIRTETESDFWGEIHSALSVLIGSGDGNSVVVTPQAGIIVVRAQPEEIETARDFLRRAEVIMRRQVVLEAKILEVQLSDGYQTGIDWSAVSNLNSNALTFGVSGSSTASPNAIGGAFSGVLQADDFFGVIELLSTQGSVQVLSSPRVSTVNNQKAVIKVGQDEFFVTEISNTTTSGAGAVTNNPEVELTPFFSGIALDVTPQISANNEIILHVHPSISEVEDQTKTITLGDQTIDLPLALSTIRETDSVVYARSGQVIVLGGLMQDKSTDNSAGTPFLSKVPGLGHLFSQQRNSTVKNELVILLKPTIMGPSGLPAMTVRSERRFKEFRRTITGDSDQQ